MASKIKGRALALVLLGSGVLAVCAGRSAAAPLTANFTEQPGGWMAGAVFDSDRKLSLCMAVRYGGNPEFGVWAAPAETGGNLGWGIAVIRPGTSGDAWPLDRNLTVDVVFNDQVHHRDAGRASDKRFLNFRLDDENAENQFRKSRTVQVSVDGKKYEFSLAGTYRLLPVLTDCVRAYVKTPPTDTALVPVTQAAEDCRQQGDFDRAIAGCSQVLRSGTKLSQVDRALAYGLRGHAYYAKGNYGQALTDINETVRLAPREAAPYYARAALHARRGDYELATADAERAMRLDPTAAVPHAILAYVLAKMGNFDRAQKEIDDAFRIQSKNSSAFLYRGEIYLLKKEPQLALKDFEASLALEPQQPFARVGRDIARAALNLPTASVAAPPAAFYGGEDVDFSVLPQSTLQEDVARPTPLAIPGGATVTTMEIRKAMEAGRPMILIDALQDPHPTTIKDAVALPYAGRAGAFDDSVQSQLAVALKDLLHGRTDVSLVFFCQGTSCWESYNAALRAHAAGFQNILWYRGGLAAWQDAGLPMQPSK